MEVPRNLMWQDHKRDNQTNVPKQGQWTFAELPGHRQMAVPFNASKTEAVAGTSMYSFRCLDTVFGLCVQQCAHPRCIPGATNFDKFRTFGRFSHVQVFAAVYVRSFLKVRLPCVRRK